MIDDRSYLASGDRLSGAILSTAGLSYTSRSDGLLANLQEKLVATTTAGGSPTTRLLPTTSTASNGRGSVTNSNTDLRTLADLATMGDKSLASEERDTQNLASEASSHDNIAKALDRYVLYRLQLG